MKKSNNTAAVATTAVTPNVVIEDISDALKKNGKTYSDEANLRRAFAYLLSGLKPVQMHILWAMGAKNRWHNKPYSKSAIIEGDCFTYSEHGSAYGAAARLAKPYIFQRPLIDGKGNFGAAVSNPDEAAARYTEMRLTEFAKDVLFYDKRLIDMGMNYLDSDPEPIMNKWVAKLPLMFMHSTEGMGYPIANRWSSCNLFEFRDQVKMYLDSGEVDCKSIFPDFATGGVIVNKSELYTLYSEGKGTVKLRGKVEVDGDTINILSLPYQSYPEDLINDIKKLVTSSNHTIKDVRNKCGAAGFLIEVECEAGTADYMLRVLYNKTCLQKSYSENRKAVMPDGTVKTVTLYEYVKLFVDANIELVKKEAQLNLDDAVGKLEIIDGLLSALDIIDDIIDDIKNSKSLDDAKTKIITRGFTANQADAIVEMRLGKLANLEQVKLQNEKKELEKIKKANEKILKSKKTQQTKFFDEFSALVDKYGWERKTQLLDVVEDVNVKKIAKPEQLKTKKEFMVVLTSENCLKKIEIAKFKQNSEDEKNVRITGNSKIILVSNKGNLYKVMSNQIEKCLPAALGTPIVNIRPEINDEKIIAIYTDDIELPYVYFVTKNGLGKCGEVKSTLLISKSIGATVCGLKSEDDEVIAIKLLDENNKIEITTSKRKEVIEMGKPQGRNSSGKKVIHLKKDEVITEVHSV